MVEEAESTMSMMTTMIAPGSLENPRNPLSTGPSDSPSPTWKLYNNPHYSVRRHNNSTVISPQKNKHSTSTYTSCFSTTISSRSRSSNYHNRDLSVFSSSSRIPMDAGPRHISLSDLDNALAEIKELRSELEFERRMRRKVEAANKVLTREKEAAEERCRRLAEEVACIRREMEKAAKEAEEERRMLRMAEALREDRIQMKLTEARMMMEDKIKEMNTTTTNNSSNNVNSSNEAVVLKGKEEGSSSGDGLIMIKKEVENPHIKRGIKGMEFPRAARGKGNGMGSSPSSREGRGGQLGSNLECQRAQLRVLMRHKSPASSRLMNAAQNLVM